MESGVTIIAFLGVSGTGDHNVTHQLHTAPSLGRGGDDRAREHKTATADRNADPFQPFACRLQLL